MKKVLIGCLAYLAMVALSWGIAVGFTWLIFLCFSLKFTLLKATGVWLVLALIRTSFYEKK